MAIDESKYPPAYINPFMDKLYEWGYVEGLWEDKRELLVELDDGFSPSESLKSFLLKNGIPEWYYKNGWKALIGAGHISQIINAWNGNYRYGHFYGEGGDIAWPDNTYQQMGDIKVAVEQWDDVVSTVGINSDAQRDKYNLWWYNPIIFTPTEGESWFGDSKLGPQFYSLNWKENPFDSIK